jgi:adenosylcobinamide kinase/adenosylcobinamide-phosphate guanylyltransferase
MLHTGIVHSVNIEVFGSGGPGGWPAPGCRCASCQQAAADGRIRAPFRVLVDGVLELSGAGLTGAAGYQVRALAGGWDVTAPDGTRLLAGPRPEVPAGTDRYDAALLDLAGDAAQLGLLRAQGLVTGGTLVLAGWADHRVRSERELARRCAFWGATPARDGDVWTVPTAGPTTGPTTGPAAAPAGVPAARVPANRPGRPWRVLVLGGAGSGKSAEAELRLAAEPEVTYVATGRTDPADPEWTARIDAHQARRPAWWHTLESTDLAGVLTGARPGGPGAARGAVLVDSVTAWLAAAMDDCGAWDTDGAGSDRAGPDMADPAARLAERTDALVTAWRQSAGYVVAVSDETGLGVVPGTRAGRLFRDELGRLNQRLAAEADEFTVVVAGRPLLTAD